MNEGSQEDIQSAVGRTIERVARESYGRLVAYLSVHTHDLASAEDARSEALGSALNACPHAPGGDAREGAPRRPASPHHACPPKRPPAAKPRGLAAHSSTPFTH